jgi:hypothetical protein
LRFFIRHGLNAPYTDFVVVVNGNRLGVAIPSAPHIRVHKRPNVGYEFCGVDEVLFALKERYDFYIFLNGSVRGPFMMQHTGEPWVHVLTSSITETVKLSGITINCHLGYTTLHLQSFLLVTDMAGLDVIKNHKLFRCYSNKQSVIQGSEIGISQAMLQAGYNIASMMTYWSGHDFRNESLTQSKCDLIKRTIPSLRTGGDLMAPGTYFSMDPNPFELMFVKANRGLVDTTSLRFYSQIM